MADLLEPFLQVVAERRLVPRRGCVLVAVSGGVDSMVLLDLLGRTWNDSRRQLVVAHFNHGLRGRSSDADERLVRRTAGALGLRCVVGRADVRASAQREGVSIEMAARTLRHAFLARAARRVGAVRIALAHHADDQVELFFLRLLRGASPSGLAGMRWQNRSPADPKLTLVRPLLGFTKDDLLAHARFRRVAFREDRSNQSTDILRNRVRRDLLPRLREKYQPATDAVIRRAMMLLADESAFVEEAAQAWLGRRRRPAFAALAIAVQRAVILQQLVSLAVAPEFSVIEQLRQQPGAPVNAASDVRLLRDARGVVRRVVDERLQFRRGELTVDVSRSGSAEFGGGRIEWTRRRVRDWNQTLAARPAGFELFDAAKVGDLVTLRHWHPGDRFQALGMRKAAKLQDWFVNRKVPAARRRQLVLAAAAGGVLCWVEGQRVAEPFKLNDQTREALEWRWRRPAG